MNEAFWKSTREQLSAIAPEPELELVEPDGVMESRHRDLVNNYRVTLTSLGGTRVRGWFAFPDGEPPARGWPAIVVFPGYTGIVPLPVHLVRYGYATLTLYPRGQGESAHEWQIEHDTWATYNLGDPDAYYYRGAYMDCVRGIDFLAERPEVDAGRIAVWGQSQGGGLTLATAALDERVKVAVAETPWPCNFELLLAMTNAAPNHEVPNYLARHADRREAILENLALVDVANLAPWITCPILLSAGEIDNVHPLATIQSVFDRIHAIKALNVYPDLDHGHRHDFARHAMHWIEQYLR